MSLSRELPQVWHPANAADHTTSKHPQGYTGAVRITPALARKVIPALQAVLAAAGENARP